MTDPLKPSVTTLVKLGSLIVHYQEYMSPTGHPNDKIAIDDIERDPEFIAWMAAMDKNAFLPKKR